MTEGHVPFVDLRAQYAAIKHEIDAAIQAVIQETSFIGGPFVRSVEEAYAEYVGVPHFIGVANGTDAIEIALEGLALPPGAEVIVPANSFIATSEAATRAGYRVVFADVDEATFTLDPADVAARISSRTAAIIVVHLYGHPADMDALAAAANSQGVRVIEDAAQSHGARIHGRMTGGLGDVGTTSFYPGKNLGAYGDAGGIMVRDDALARRVRMIANHGRTHKYDHEFEGRNSRLDSLQAAILGVKLRYIEMWTSHRRDLADRYLRGLEDVGDLVLPTVRESCTHAYHLFVVRTRVRDGLQEALRSHGIATGVHYPTALPRLAAYRQHPQHEEPFRAVRLSTEVLSLPMGDGITPHQVDIVVDAIRRFFGASR